MKKQNCKFSEFTESNSDLVSENLVDDVRNFAPAQMDIEGRGAHVLAAKGYVLVYTEPQKRR